MAAGTAGTAIRPPALRRPPQGRIAIVTGDAGSATCDLAPGDGFSVRCSETLSGIQVDLGEVQRMAQGLPAPMAALFVGVASRFSGEPIGVVEIR